MKLRNEHQQLGNRICEMVFLFLYGLVRVLPISLFHQMAGPFLHVFICFAIPRKRVIRNLSAVFGRSYSGAGQRNSGTFFSKPIRLLAATCRRSTRDEDRPH